MIRLNPANLIDKIIALWHTEDILRAHAFDVDAIKKKQENMGEDEESWLKAMAEQMHKEKIAETGHLKESLVDIEKLFIIHQSQAKDSTLIDKFGRIEKALNHHPDKAQHLNHIHTCFEMMYAYYLKQLEGDEVSKNITLFVTGIGDYLNTLNLLYQNEQ